MRVKQVAISYKFLEEFLKEGPAKWVRFEGLPEDAELVSASAPADFGFFFLNFFHESFAEVQECAPIPRLNLRGEHVERGIVSAEEVHVEPTP